MEGAEKGCIISGDGGESCNACVESQTEQWLTFSHGLRD